MLAELLEYALANEQLLFALGSLSILGFVGSLLCLPFLIARMPARYFLERQIPPGSFRERHPLLRVAMHAVKNALGAVLVIAGLTMLLLPGQGLLTILIGMTLLDFPGKRRFELWLVSRPAIARAITWIRRRSGRPPLELPARDSPAPSGDLE